jgi:hypothetical protein
LVIFKYISGKTKFMATLSIVNPPSWGVLLDKQKLELPRASQNRVADLTEILIVGVIAIQLKDFDSN